MYESFYGLTAKPFHLAPDPRFFFPSSTHRRALAYLRYGVKKGEGFVVVTGGIGTGKTTLVETLLAELARIEDLVVARLSLVQIDGADLLRTVARAFGLIYEGPDQAALRQALEAFLAARKGEGSRALLIVDEAQELKRETMEQLLLLSQLQNGDDALLQSCLIGQEVFQEHLQSEGLKPLQRRIVGAYQLVPLGEAETKAYMQHRLTVAGWKGQEIFPVDTCRLIYRWTQGNLSQINMICDRLLLYGYQEEKRHINGDIFDAVAEEIELEHAVPLERPFELYARAPQGETAPAALAQGIEARVAALESEVSQLRRALSRLGAAADKLGS
jgi:type II secretory pathway predicted ATPase ExeA